MYRKTADRRRFVRLADDVTVDLVRTGEAEAAASRTLNFSAGGVLVLSDKPLPAGTRVHVRLTAEDGRPLEFEAEVVRVRSRTDHEHEIALEFVGGSIDDQRALQDAIAARLGPDDSNPAPFTPQTA